ncbi:DNA methyltransferase [Burkholderia orbicola]|uniref:DNA methyltransferase n=1 Tax=Burkholderia orbicola TaxID=2978683 RepID=UPI0019089CCF|nr:DNA methyltransferase [Burkholderia orbicola]MBK1820514.1 class I SAM-dependent DNA methyltransferase [Burkholderia orbicola]
MNIAQVEEKVKALVGDINQAEFLYGLLECYGKPKASITRLRMEGKGSYNLSKSPDEVLWKKQVYFKTTDSDKLLTIIDEMRNADVVEKHLPRFIIAINSSQLLAIDTKTEDTLDIPISELGKKADFFLPWAGLEKAQAQGENPADVKAAEKMAKLFDLLRADNPANTPQEIHWQNVFLSRILFCYFAEDTGIFKAKLFTNHVASHTAEDGGDLGDYLSSAFDVMNQEGREGVPAYLADFPYVNGGLFADKLPVPKFNRKSRAMLIECGADLNWSEINPDIFGSMIQAVVDPSQRGNMGMHYTSVPNIMKVIEPLFLNELKEEFEKHSDSKAKLEQLLLRLEHLKIFDPACGSGNFLIIAYKELRQLEMEIFKRLQEVSQEGLIPLSRIKLSQFYGIELDDFAHEIAILSLWLAEHQMNQKFKATFGHCNPALPLKTSGNVVQGNATEVNWNSVCTKQDGHEVFILGNPPYLGSRNQTDSHKQDMKRVFVDDYKSLDYVACWYFIAANYIRGTAHKFAFVSTNSICQGEQVALIWPRVLGSELEISFAHQSFKWENRAKGNAGVICVIIGVRSQSKQEKTIYSKNVVSQVSSINPYLVPGSITYITRRSKPISRGFPSIVYGTLINDAGNLVFETDEMLSFTDKHPETKRLFRKFIGSKEYIRGEERWCLYIKDEDLGFARQFPALKSRLEAVTQHRQASTEQSTRNLASQPNRFYFSGYDETAAIIVPRTSSERRDYIPMGFVGGEVIISDAAQAIYGAEPWILGVISSRIHMVWVRAVAGRLKTDYRYSSALCYNTFPYPNLSDSKRAEITNAVLEVLSVREMHPEKTLAKLYDPDLMPDDLLAAHEYLDGVIDSCYQAKPFRGDDDRLECLFKLYEKMTGNKNA